MKLRALDERILAYLRARPKRKVRIETLVEECQGKSIRRVTKSMERLWELGYVDDEGRAT